MSLERAEAHLAQFGREGDAMEFNVSSATVELAARAVGCEPASIAKTLSLFLSIMNFHEWHREVSSAAL